MKYFSELTDDEIKNLSSDEFLEMTLSESVESFNKSILTFRTRVKHLTATTIIAIIAVLVTFNMFGLFSLAVFVPSLILSVFVYKAYDYRNDRLKLLRMDVYLSESCGILDEDNMYILKNCLNKIIEKKNPLEF